jgi:hypothetical protein
MKITNGFELRHLLPLVGILCANITVLPFAHASEPYDHWMCDAVQAMPGTPVGTTTTAFPGGMHNDIWLKYYQHLANGEATIFGNIVPYDKVWLNGDAAAPIFKTEHDIIVGDLFVPAGSYSLYFLPSLKGWKLIVNRQIGQAGNVYDANQDLGRVTMVQAAAAGCEILTLDFNTVPGKECSGRCNVEDGPFVPRDVSGKHLIHIAWAEANYYVVLRSPINSERAGRASIAPE